MDDRIRQLLKDLGEAINESISSSEDVNEHIQRIRDEGYNLYVVLDATIGLDKQDGEQGAGLETSTVNAKPGQQMVPLKKNEVQFRIDINDLNLLRSLGIDPTRKVKVPKRLEAKTTPEIE